MKICDFQASFQISTDEFIVLRCSFRVRRSSDLNRDILSETGSRESTFVDVRDQRNTGLCDCGNVIMMSL